MDLKRKKFENISMTKNGVSEYGSVTFPNLLA
jgi:hypothetical protein